MFKSERFRSEGKLLLALLSSSFVVLHNLRLSAVYLLAFLRLQLRMRRVVIISSQQGY